MLKSRKQFSPSCFNISNQLLQSKIKTGDSIDMYCCMISSQLLMRQSCQ